MSSEIKVDTISENTSANGIAIDGLTLKDGNVGAAGTATSIAGVTFYVGQSGSIYTTDVSGTDDSAENNTAFGTAALDAITTGDNNMAFGENTPFILIARLKVKRDRLEEYKELIKLIAHLKKNFIVMIFTMTMI